MAPPVSDYGASTSSRRLERPKPPSIGSSKSGGSKGKGRAIDDDDLDRQVGQDGDGEDGSADLQAIKGMSFSIRFTDGTTDDLVDIYVNNGEAIRDVKRRIRILRPSLSTNRLRLIYLGRVLMDGVRLVPYMTSLLQRQRTQEDRENKSNIGDLLEGVVNRAVHSFDESGSNDTNESHDGRHNGHQAAASMNPYENYTDSKKPLTSIDKGKGKQKDPSESQPPLGATKIWLHCSVGEPGSLEQESETAPEQQQTNTRAPLAGFDRLREAGFSEEEIANIRAQFHVDGPGDTVVTGDEDEHARALEEQWMDNLGTGGAGDLTGPTGDMYGTLFKGVIVGFFFPFLPLFFFRAADGETPVFSKRMQMAIVAGLSINLLYGALRAMS